MNEHEHKHPSAVRCYLITLITFELNGNLRFEIQLRLT